ncbi:MAG: hypothetical protein MUP71_10460 [Candidatus Aminicenantes bacterium]|jgi:hypothetical protein|nr:hypothetical protein [Candidatus Aminicenantes bacterium]
MTPRVIAWIDLGCLSGKKSEKVIGSLQFPGVEAEQITISRAVAMFILQRLLKDFLWNVLSINDFEIILIYRSV